VYQIMRVYQRCRQWKCLPSQGGLMDQDERMMEMLDVIDVEVEKWKAKRNEERQGDMMKDQMLNTMGGKRG
jgi:hypothetical protein